MTSRWSCTCAVGLSGVFVLGCGSYRQPSADPAMTVGTEPETITDAGTDTETDTDTATDTETDTDTDTGSIFDTVNTETDTGVDPCQICEDAEFSYLWVANSPESTVSKINTRTLVEEGRYLTHPSANGNPSRTSVSVDGSAVAVANRNTGLIKIWSKPELCDPDTNGQPGLQTSTGAGDVLPWGEDDCVAWYLAFDTDGATVQRPVAWTQGTLNEDTCVWEDQKIWTVTGRLGAMPGSCGASGLYVHLVDGDSGVVEQTQHVPEGVLSCLFGNSPSGLGAYAAAVDVDGDLWFHVHGQSGLLEVRLADLSYERVGSSQYGLTVDTNGRVWAAGSGIAYRYDPETGVTDSVALSTGFSGLAQDLQGRVWMGSDGTNDPHLLGLDMETMELVADIDLPGSWYVKGVSVDVDGYIWVVHGDDTRAYRIDPDDFANIEFYEGLNDPYTYSDMTGGQISNVTCNPPIP